MCIDVVVTNSQIFPYLKQDFKLKYMLYVLKTISLSFPFIYGELYLLGDKSF